MQNGLPSVDVVLEEARRKLDFQFNQLDSLDTKASIVLGSAGVILMLLLTAVLVVDRYMGFTLELAKASFILVSVAIILSVIKLWVRTYQRPPHLDWLRRYYIVKNPNETKLKMIDSLLKAISYNDEILNKQSSLVKCSYVFLLIGLGAFICSFWITM